MAKYYKRKDGRYTTQVYLGRDKETGKRKVKPLYARTIKELDAKLADFKALKNKGIIIDDKNYTLEQWVDEWIKVYKSNLTESSKRVYFAFKSSIAKSIGHIKLKDLKEYHVMQYKAYLLERVTPLETKQRIAKLKSCLNAAMTNEYIYKNPAVGVTVDAKRETTRRALTVKERKLFLDADLNLKEKAFVYIMYYTGCRAGEIMALTLPDIDLKNDLIYITKHIDFHDQEVLDGTKNGENKTLPIWEPLKPVLIDYINSLNNQLYIFVNKLGNIYGSSYSDFWATIMRHVNVYAGGNANIKAIDFDITPHYFRHNFATLLYEADVDIKTAMELMGHKDQSTLTKIYTHLSEEKKKKSMGKLSTFFGETKAKDDIQCKSHSSQ